MPRLVLEAEAIAASVRHAETERCRRSLAATRTPPSLRIPSVSGRVPGVAMSTARPVWCSLKPGAALTVRIASIDWPAASLRRMMSAWWRMLRNPETSSNCTPASAALCFISRHAAAVSGASRCIVPTTFGSTSSSSSPPRTAAGAGCGRSRSVFRGRRTGRSSSWHRVYYRRCVLGDAARLLAAQRREHRELPRPQREHGAAARRSASGNAASRRASSSNSRAKRSIDCCSCARLARDKSPATKRKCSPGPANDESRNSRCTSRAKNFCTGPSLRHVKLRAVSSFTRLNGSSSMMRARCRRISSRSASASSIANVLVICGERPAVDEQIHHQQQLRIGEQRVLLLGRQLREELAPLVHQRDEVGDLEPEQIQDLLEALQRERLRARTAV